MPETYIAVDLELSGPIINRNGILEFGWAVVQNERVVENDSIFINDPTTSTNMETNGWLKSVGFWNRYRKNTKTSPNMVSETLKQMLKKYESLTFVGYPIGVEFAWLNQYWIRHQSEPWPFGYSGIDLETLVWTKIGGKLKEYSDDTIESLTQVGQHPDLQKHSAKDDAYWIAQQFIALQMILSNKSTNT